MKANLPFRYITTTKRGKYYILFDFRDKDNNRKRKWVGTGLPETCTKKALSSKTDEIVTEFYKGFLDGSVFAPKKYITPEGLVSNGTNVTTGYEFTDFLIFWLETTKHTISEVTYRSYQQCIKKTINYFEDNFPHLKLEDLKALHLQQFYNAKYSSGLTANTIKHYHANIHKALEYAVKMDILPSNVSEKTDRPKLDKFEATFYNKEELQQLFKLFEGDKMEIIVLIAAYYGLRRSEIIGLKWSAIDFERNTITIQEKAYCIREKGVTVTKFQKNLKTKASYRTLPLIPTIKEKLLKRKEFVAYYSELIKKQYNHEYEEYLCTDNLGNIISPDYVSRRFKEIIRAADLKRLRFHDLRHSCASLLLANGVPMKAIQEWLGHSTFNVTADYYSHLEYDSKISSAEKIASALDFIDSKPQESQTE